MRSLFDSISEVEKAGFFFMSLDQARASNASSSRYCNVQVCRIQSDFLPFILNFLIYYNWCLLFFLFHNFRVFVATWNVGGKSPHSGLNLDDFLQVHDHFDIYVLGYAFISLFFSNSMLLFCGLLLNSKVRPLFDYPHSLDLQRKTCVHWLLFHFHIFVT